MTKSARLFIISAVSLLLFGVTAAFVLLGVTADIENAAGAAARALRNGVLTPVLTVITNIGDWIFITAFCILLLIFPRTRMRLGVPLAFALVGSAAANQVIKRIAARPRPDVMYHMVEEDGFSFPSGHSMNNSVFYIILIIAVWLFLKRTNIKVLLTVLCSVMLGIIMFSRLYLGVHYLGDLLAGFLLGACIACAAYGIWLIILRKIDEKKRVKAESVRLRGADD